MSYRNSLPSIGSPYLPLVDAKILLNLHPGVNMAGFDRPKTRGLIPATGQTEKMPLNHLTAIGQNDFPLDAM
jgi:hypothetical protein